MRRVLVPLDGTALAAAILPDAKQLAGVGGELILLRYPSGMGFGHLNAKQIEEETVGGDSNREAFDGGRQQTTCGTAAQGIDSRAAWR